MISAVLVVENPLTILESMNGKINLVLSSFPPFFTQRARCAYGENFFFHFLLFSPYRAKYARCEIFIEIEKQGVSPICRRTSQRVQFLEAANGRQGIARSQ